MKRVLCVLLALWMFAVHGLAEEENPFAPYGMTVPEGAVVEAGEGSQTFVRGATRVVAMVISRVPDEDPADALVRLMAQFDPQAVIEHDLFMSEGFYGLYAIHEDKFGEGVDAHNILVLTQSGDLLILSGYDMEGDGDGAERLVLEVLMLTTVDGEIIFPVAG